MGISEALYSGSKCYFFDGDRYVRVTRGDVGAGTVDEGYPRNISKWGWPSGFGSDGIDAALFSGPAPAARGGPAGRGRRSRTGR